MNRYFLGLLLLICLGCSPNYRKRVPGVWKVDPASISGDVTPELKERLSQGKVTFEEDGTVNGVGLGLNGKWVADGQKILLSSPMPEQQVQMPEMTLNKEATRIDVAGPGGKIKCSLVKAK